MYCSNCGNYIAENAKYCSNCGCAIANTNVPSITSNAISSSGSGDYRLILVDKGTCKASTTENLLEDLLGYTAEDADQFVEIAPVEIADNLSLLQARTVAQAFSEYGCEMAIIDESGDYVNANQKAISSVYDTDGNLLEKAAAIIGALTIVNKVTSFRRHKRPSMLDFLFKPQYSIRPPREKRHRPFMEPMPRHMEPRMVPPKPTPSLRGRGNMVGRGHAPVKTNVRGGRGPGRGLTTSKITRKKIFL